MKTAWAGAAVCVIAICFSPARAGEMTKLERQRLIAHLEMTGTWLEDEVSNLSPAQLHFNPPGSWSVLEVLDHLVVCEPIYWKDFHNAMKAPPASRRVPKPDDTVLWYGVDRTGRQKAAAGEDSSGKLKDAKAGLDGFRRLRTEMLEYARATNEDLRAHLVPREQCDAYQWFLLISTHSQRHILQIREIKANPGFPRR